MRCIQHIAFELLAFGAIHCRIKIVQSQRVDRFGN